MAKLNKQQREHIVQRFLNEVNKLAPKVKTVPIPDKLKGKFKMSMEVSVRSERYYHEGLKLGVYTETPKLDALFAQQPATIQKLYVKYKADVKAAEKAKETFQTKRHDARLALEEKLLFMGSDLDIEAVLADSLKKFK